MPEFVEHGGRYIFDAKAGTVKTVMIIKDASGRTTEAITHCTTVQIFKAWCAEMRAVEAEIDAHYGRQNVYGMDGARRHAADTA